MRFTKTLSLLLALFLFFTACQNSSEEVTDSTYEHQLVFSPGQEEAIRTALITIKDNTEVFLKSGQYQFSKLSIQGQLSNILFRGEGPEKTIIDFSDQNGGGEGMRVDDVTGFAIKDMKLTESKGDLLKINNCQNVSIENVHTVWEGEPSIENGGYGIYPVLCKNVTIDRCYVRGASDAGVYVGQTIGAVVKNSKAEYNVAGFEIENTQNAEAFNNEATNNTGGFLVFDHPGLKHDGTNIKVYDNNIYNNNYRNFAPAANSASGVGNLPPGTGILVMRTSNVEVYNNTIKDNNTMAVGILSYLVVDPNIVQNHPAFDPIPRNITLKNNTITKQSDFPEPVKDHELAQMLVQLYQKLEANELASGGMHEIIYDGVQLQEGPNPNNICIQENGDAKFLNMDVANDFAAPNFNVEPYLCSLN